MEFGTGTIVGNNIELFRSLAEHLLSQLYNEESDLEMTTEEFLMFGALLEN